MTSLRGSYEVMGGEYQRGGDGCNESPATVSYIFNAQNLVINVP